MVGLIGIAIESVGQRTVDPLDQIQYFSWLGYGVVAAVYSAFVFRSELSKKHGPLIFSKRNARPILIILGAHAAFLVILFALLRTVSALSPLLPAWITDTFGVRGTRVSIADLSFVVMATLMHLVERRWLYVEREIGLPQS